MADDARTWDDERLAAALDRSARAGAGWGPIAVLPSTGSTNADAADQVREGAPEGFTVVADEQTHGRGRLGRAWESPAGAGLAMSVVLRPVVIDRHWSWLPLLVGVAVSDALRDVGLPASLTWPNDVMVDRDAHDGSPGPRKLGGVLVERVEDAVVVGIGINVDLDHAELPVPRATSTRLEGVDVRREDLVVAVLDRLRGHYLRWQLADGDARRCGLLDAYTARCLTLDRPLRATLPGNVVLQGIGASIDADGRLVVRLDDGTLRPVSAGDVTVVR